jgi:hypothetical protein
MSVVGSYKKLVTHMFSTNVSGYLYNVDEQLEAIIDQFSLLRATFVLSVSSTRHDIHVMIMSYVADMF